MTKKHLKTIQKNREQRQNKVRVKVKGNFEKPRLSVFRSAQHIYAQIIDDLQAKTLVAASDLDLKLTKKATKTENAREVGKLLAARAKEKGITQVIFDRGRCLYHGRVQALAEGAREGGLNF
ncbi:MAG: large subunit ribosomal protein [Patescibacteria group bacterium]|nr:large subunit ribosomal protein [Patescibacteria group bacterium]